MREYLGRYNLVDQLATSISYEEHLQAEACSILVTRHRQSQWADYAHADTTPTMSQTRADSEDDAAESAAKVRVSICIYCEDSEGERRLIEDDSDGRQPVTVKLLRFANGHPLLDDEHSSTCGIARAFQTCVNWSRWGLEPAANAASSSQTTLSMEPCSLQFSCPAGSSLSAITIMAHSLRVERFPSMTKTYTSPSATMEQAFKRATERCFDAFARENPALFPSRREHRSATIERELMPIWAGALSEMVCLTSRPDFTRRILNKLGLDSHHMRSDRFAVELLPRLCAGFRED